MGSPDGDAPGAAAGEAAAAVSPSEAAAEVASADISDTPPSSVGGPGELQAAGDKQSTPHATPAGDKSVPPGCCPSIDNLTERET